MADDTVEAVQAQLLDALRKSQETALQAVRSFTESARSMLPDAKPLADALPDLPDPAELVDKAFGFASELLAQQREFARELLKAATPSASKAKDKPA